MTDERLIELIENYRPEELTGEVLAVIRSRLSSPAVREAMLTQVRLDQALHQTVAQFRLPVELLLAKAAAIQATSTVAKLFGWGSVTALMIGVVSVGTFVALRPETAQKVAKTQVFAEAMIDDPPSPSDVAPGDRPPRNLAAAAESPEVNRDVAQIPMDAEKDVLPSNRLYFADAQEADAWRQSFESVAGDIRQRTFGNRTELVLSGAQRLKSSWPAFGRMRMTVTDHDRFKIHLSTSAKGEAAGLPDHLGWPASPSSLTLEYFATPRPMWVAWLAAHRANRILPETLAIAAHDEGRVSELGFGTIDIAYHRGEVLLTQGENQLLAAPLSGVPDRVVFEGEAVLQGLNFAEGLAAATDREPLAPLTDVIGPPIDHAWQCNLPAGATWNRLAEGRVELLAEDSSAEASASCSMNGLDAREIVFQLEDPLPGTGIALLDERGEACYQLGFISGPEPNQVCFRVVRPDDTLPSIGEGPVPLCPARPWFRFVLANPEARAWFSCDGSHWSPVLGGNLPLKRLVAAVGVYCLPGPGTRSIRIARFGAIDGQAPAANERESFGLHFSPPRTVHTLFAASHIRSFPRPLQ